MNSVHAPNLLINGRFLGRRATGVDRFALETLRALDQLIEAGDPLVAGNVAYERRFGHVFLICATGRTAPEVLAELTRRLGNDAAAERDEVRRELAAIVRLRLAKLVSEEDT